MEEGGGVGKLPPALMMSRVQVALTGTAYIHSENIPPATVNLSSRPGVRIGDLMRVSLGLSSKTITCQHVGTADHNSRGMTGNKQGSHEFRAHPLYTGGMNSKVVSLLTVLLFALQSKIKLNPSCGLGLSSTLTALKCPASGPCLENACHLAHQTDIPRQRHCQVSTYPTLGHVC
jgi:hypothetical protein